MIALAPFPPQMLHDDIPPDATLYWQPFVVPVSVLMKWYWSFKKWQVAGAGPSYSWNVSNSWTDEEGGEHSYFFNGHWNCSIDDEVFPNHVSLLNAIGRPDDWGAIICSSALVIESHVVKKTGSFEVGGTGGGGSGLIDDVSDFELELWIMRPPEGMIKPSTKVTCYVRVAAFGNDLFVPGDAPGGPPCVMTVILREKLYGLQPGENDQTFIFHADSNWDFIFGGESGGEIELYGIDTWL